MKFVVLWDIKQKQRQLSSFFVMLSMIELEHVRAVRRKTSSSSLRVGDKYRHVLPVHGTISNTLSQYAKFEGGQSPHGRCRFDDKLVGEISNTVVRFKQKLTDRSSAYPAGYRSILPKS